MAVVSIEDLPLGIAVYVVVFLIVDDRVDAVVLNVFTDGHIPKVFQIPDVMKIRIPEEETGTQVAENNGISDDKWPDFLEILWIIAALVSQILTS